MSMKHRATVLIGLASAFVACKHHPPICTAVDGGFTDAGIPIDAGVVCSDGTPSNPTCSTTICYSQSDCCSGTTCKFTGQSTLPICTQCTHETNCALCDLDAGMLCQTWGGDGTCTCPNTTSGQVTVCQSSCVNNTSLCPTGSYACSPSGACLPVSCAEGFACESWEICSPNNQASNAHGCLANTCSTSDDCSGGSCMNGVCTVMQVGNCE
jgi:hypothetical protein